MKHNCEWNTMRNKLKIVWRPNDVWSLECNASRNVLAIIDLKIEIEQTLYIGKNIFTGKKNLEINRDVWGIALWQERLASNLILNNSNCFCVGRWVHRMDKIMSFVNPLDQPWSQLFAPIIPSFNWAGISPEKGRWSRWAPVLGTASQAKLSKSLWSSLGIVAALYSTTDAAFS